MDRRARMHRAPPTIEELDKILNAPASSADVTVNQDGATTAA